MKITGNMSILWSLQILGEIHKTFKTCVIERWKQTSSLWPAAVEKLSFCVKVIGYFLIHKQSDKASLTWYFRYIYMYVCILMQHFFLQHFRNFLWHFVLHIENNRSENVWSLCHVVQKSYHHHILAKVKTTNVNDIYLWLWPRNFSEHCRDHSLKEHFAFHWNSFTSVSPLYIAMLPL